MYLKEKAAGLDMAGVPCNQWREKHHDTAASGLILPRSQLSQCTMEILAAPPCNIQLGKNEKPCFLDSGFSITLELVFHFRGHGGSNGKLILIKGLGLQNRFITSFQKGDWPEALNSGKGT